MKHFLPHELKFIKQHVGIDMTPREIALFLDTTQHEIMRACEGLKIGGGVYNSRPTAMHTPRTGKYPLVAQTVRKATIKDAYEPMDLGVYQDAMGLL